MQRGMSAAIHGVEAIYRSGADVPDAQEWETASVFTDEQSGLVRFVENHDEARAASAFPGDRWRAAAVVATAVPGAKLLHDGQLDGRRTRVPVFLARRPAEAADPNARVFYTRLLAALHLPALRQGEWRLAEVRGWPDNQSCRKMIQFHLSLLSESRQNERRWQTIRFVPCTRLWPHFHSLLLLKRDHRQEQGVSRPSSLTAPRHDRRTRMSLARFRGRH
jgi:hypothetical protein